MSADAKQSGPKLPFLGSSQPVGLIALATVGAVWIVLVAAKWIWDVPKPMLLTVGAASAIWAAFIGLRRRTRTQPLLRTLLLLCLPWCMALALSLSALYAVDRGGWLWYLVTGYDVYPVDNLSDQIDRSPADFVSRHPAFVLDAQDAAHLRLPAGEYTFAQTVVVPRNTLLTIEPGAVLRFGPGRSLIAYSPIVARGTAAAPIWFGARHRGLKWGVVGIVEAAPSVFEHVRWADSRQARVNGIEFVAGLTIFDADVEIVHSQFVHAFGKDAVNVRRGHVLIRENLFRQTYKDGLDLDGGSGEVSHNQFVDCADEGIDLSENENIQVFDNTIVDRHGGRIDADVNLAEIRAANTLGYSAQFHSNSIDTK